MKIIDVIAQAIGYTVDGVTGGKQIDKYFYIILFLVVIGLFLFTYLMS